MAWRGSPRACFLNSVSKMWVTTSAARVAIALHGGKVRDKFCPLGIYLAHSASDVGFEQPSPVVIFDIPGMAQRLFHGVAEVIESRKPLHQTLMFAHHTHHRPSVPLDLRIRTPAPEAYERNLRYHEG